MKNTTSIKKAIPAIILAAALAVSVAPLAAMSSNAATLSTTATQASKVDDATREYFINCYDSSTAYLGIYYNQLPTDVRTCLECARDAAYPLLNSDDLAAVTQASSDLRIALRVAESTIAGIPVDTNAAPEFVLGTNGGNVSHAMTISWATAGKIGDIYSMCRNQTGVYARTLVVNNFVERLYPIALGRTADIASRDMYTNAILNGTMTPDQVAATILGSAECNNKLTDNKAFVTACYQAFFDRQPDTQGLNNWVNALNNGMTRAELVSTFEAQTSWTNLCAYYGF